jgi:hypothetical protein
VSPLLGGGTVLIVNEVGADVARFPAMSLAMTTT